MKQRLFVLILLTVVSFACSKQAFETTNAISFTPSVDVPTRVSGNSFEVDDVIGLYVTQYEGNTSPALQLGGNYASNVPVAYDGHAWTSNPKLYWGDGKTDIYAYYPKMEVSSIDELPFSVALDQSAAASGSSMDPVEASDFLWTKMTGLSRMDTVPLVFKHKMSKVVVKLQKGEDYEGDFPSDAVLLIHNTIPEALIDLSSGDVIKSPKVSVQTIVAHSDGSGSFSAILVPQMLTNRVPLFELVCKDVSYLVESKFNFKSGVCHTVNFTLSNNPERVLITIGGEIVGWN